MRRGVDRTPPFPANLHDHKQGDGQRLDRHEIGQGLTEFLVLFYHR
ncbi:hypothetical protein OSJ18_00710 [Mycobacterium ulcerans]